MSDSNEPVTRQYGDLQALRRMLSYMYGFKTSIILLLLCIIGEALCTMGTLSLVKPMTDLMFTGRLMERPNAEAQVPFVLGVPAEQEDGRTVGVVGVGGAADPASLRDLRSFLSQYITGSVSDVVVDLSRLKGIGPDGWATISYGRAMADATTGTRLTVFLPDNVKIVPSAGPAQTAHSELTVASGERRSQFGGILGQAQVPPTPENSVTVKAGTVKAWLYGKILPYVEAVEAYSRGNLMSVMGILLGIMMVFAVGVALFGYGLNYYSSMLSRYVSLRIQEDLFRKSLGMDVSYFTRKRDADLMSIVMNDSSIVTDTVEIIFGGFVRTPITLGTLLVGMLIISPKLTFFCVTVLPIMGIFIALLGRRIRRIGRKMREHTAHQTGVVQESYAGIRVIKSYNTEAREEKRFVDINSKLMRDFRKVVIATESGERVIRLLGFVTVGLMIFFGGWIVLGTRELSASDFTLFVALLSQVFRPLQAISKTNSRLQRGLACCDRIYSVLDEVSTIQDRPDAKPLPKISREIRFENLSFRYDGADHDVLREIDLVVPQGRKVAIVGETGSGKSTLVNLLPRFFDPTSGRILIDGHDLRDVTQRSLRDQIALITQEVVLFDDTVANNITYGTDGVSYEQMVAAARQANAYKFITERLDNGFETRVGARGGRLSGGERQRIAIARAIVKDAPILILDEATSALDAETESLIQDALDHVMQGRTVFVIAHRLSTIRNCDIIYVMDKGQIVESGTHDELMALDGRYAKYYNIQFGRNVPSAD